MWYYGGIGITVIEFDDTDNEQIIAELQPLQASTVRQIFGWTAPKATLRALVVGSGDVTSLKALLNDGVAYTLSGMENDLPVFIGNFLPQKMNFRRMATYKQTFRPDKPSTEQVFEATITLLEE